MTSDRNFKGCDWICRFGQEHSRIWGRCEFGVQPEPSVSMSAMPPEFEGTVFDTYNVTELAELIKPALRGVWMAVGPADLAAASRGERIRPLSDEGAGMGVAITVARAIIYRNDPPAPVPLPGVPVCGADCPCRRVP